MGHHKTTITTRDISLTLSFYEEENEELSHKRVHANVELELANGSTYECEESIDETDDSDTLIEQVCSAISPDSDEYEPLRSALDQVITDAEEDIGHTIELQPTEVITAFKHHTNPETAV